MFPLHYRFNRPFVKYIVLSMCALMHLLITVLIIVSWAGDAPTGSHPRLDRTSGLHRMGTRPCRRVSGFSYSVSMILDVVRCSSVARRCTTCVGRASRAIARRHGLVRRVQDSQCPRLGYTFLHGRLGRAWRSRVVAMSGTRKVLQKQKHQHGA